MYLFRSSFITATFSVMLAGQCATVFAAPQLGMRPYLHVYGIDASGPDVSSVRATATAAVIESAVPSVVESSDAAETNAAETTQPADASSTDGTTEAVAQTNGAFSKTTGLRIVLFVGSVTAALQLL